jgi:hypothetical protein
MGFSGALATYWFNATAYEAKNFGSIRVRATSPNVLLLKAVC